MLKTKELNIQCDLGFNTQAFTVFSTIKKEKLYKHMS